MDYYKKDFKFLSSYAFEFKDELNFRIDDYLSILYQGQQITTIVVEVPVETMRLYKINLYPEYSRFY